MAFSSCITVTHDKAEFMTEVNFLLDNPYYRPIAKFLGSFRAVNWGFPFIPGLVNGVVLVLIIAILCVLYASVGIASQISTSFVGLIADARCQLREGSSVEKSAYTVAIGIYFVLLLPFWMVQFPFQVLGSLWERNGLLAIALLIPILGGIYLASNGSLSRSNVLDWFRHPTIKSAIPSAP